MFKRIFLSYGHDEHTPFVVQLKNDLKERGYQVWFDEERLKAGTDWEGYIEDGLDQTSQVGGEGCLLLVMTPYSVRRPTGFCLNEIARANVRGLPIIPIKLAECEPPLAICRTQWLDMRDCLPLERSAARYQTKFARLIEAFEHNRLEFEGMQSRLLHYLQPLPFDAEISQHLARFTGRQWVFREIDAWFARPAPSRVFWITGAPGVGKTALAAWLCHHRREVAALHLCRYGHVQKSDPRKAVLSIAYQLSSQLPDYAARLNELDLARLIPESNAQTLFDDLIVQPLSSGFPPPEGTLAILIDALDEATDRGRNPLAEFIAAEFHKTPAWLRLVTTSRPEPEVKHALQALTPYVLDASAPQNLEDIRAFVAAEFRPFTFCKSVPPERVETILGKSEGVFLYVEWLRRECELGRLSLCHVEHFPQGLGGIYVQFFSRQFPDPERFEREALPLLEAIAAAREPLEVGYLASLFGWSEYERERILGELGSLFPICNHRVRPFHQSVVDWLTHPERAGRYFTSRSAGHARHMSFGWQRFERGACAMPRYSIVHLPAHLSAVRGRGGDLRRLLLDFNWLQAKLENADVTALIADYDYLIFPADSAGAHGTPPGRTPPDPTGLPGAPIGIPPWRYINESEGRKPLAHSPHFLAPSPPSLVQAALRLSAHVLVREKNQLASQLVGRLKARDSSEIRRLLEAAGRWRAAPWLKLQTASLTAPGGPLVRVLTGHSNAVRAVAATPDGKRSVSASDDQTLKVWDLESGNELQTLAGHSGGVYGVAVTPEGKRAVSASGDWTLKVWDLESGKELQTLAGHSGGVYGVAVTADGKRAVSASEDETLRVWDLENGNELQTLAGHSGGVYGVAVTPDGKCAVSASRDHTLKVWDLESGKALQTLAGHSAGVNGVAVTPEGRRAVSASWDRTLKVWDLENGKELQTLEGHTNWVNGVAVTADGKRAVSASWDQTLKVWDLESGKELQTLAGHSGGVYGVAVMPEVKRAVSASYDQTLKVWDLESGKELQTLATHSTGVYGVAVTPEGKRAVSASHDQTLKVWDLESGKELQTLTGHSDGVNGVAVTPDGKCAVSASWDWTLKVWDLESGKALQTLAGHSNWVNGVAVTPEGRRAVSASWDRTLKVWDLESGKELQTLAGHTNWVNGVAVTPEGKRAVSASGDWTLKVWDLESGKELQTLAGHSGGVYGVAVTADGKHAVSASEDQTLRVWDLESGKELQTLAAHSDAVWGVAVMPEGKRAVSASEDQTLRVWDLDTRKVIATFTADASLRSCAVGPDGRVIVAGDASGRVHFLTLILKENK